MTGIPAKVRAAVKERADGHCEACGFTITGSGHVHHRKLLAQGGRHELANLIHIHFTCHEVIHSNVGGRSYGLGLLVRRHDDPAEIPVVLLGRSLMSDVTPLTDAIRDQYRHAHTLVSPCTPESPCEDCDGYDDHVAADADEPDPIERMATFSEFVAAQQVTLARYYYPSSPFNVPWGQALVDGYAEYERAFLAGECD